jgi:hypothetical protein
VPRGLLTACYQSVMATLHFIYGKPRAGKTRLALELAACMPAVPFIEDEWLVLLCEPITTLDEFAQGDRRVRSVIAPLATRILELARQSSSTSRRIPCVPCLGTFDIRGSGGGACTTRGRTGQ